MAALEVTQFARNRRIVVHNGQRGPALEAKHGALSVVEVDHDVLIAFVLGVIHRGQIDGPDP